MMKPVRNYSRLREKIMAGLADATEKLIKEHIATNRPLIVSRNGKIEEVDAREYLPLIRRAD